MSSLTRVSSLFSYLQQQFLKVVVPPFCAYCKCFLSARQVLCSRCQNAIKPVVSVTVPVTALFGIRVHAISDYQEPLRSLVLAKRWSDRAVAAQLGQLMWKRTPLRHLPCDYLIPIPLHWRRYAARGYNQATQMARVLSQNKNVSVVELLRRLHHTQTQAQLRLNDRQKNVAGVFALHPNINKASYRGKHLVLVDDLLTTGATLRAAAKELKTLKPASLSAIVACRVV